ncbi:hypothetical protein BC938DRAFT_481873 [Jimgerdemannia flammicorona]|uniref:Uncharacterized protein n=1 Tax=Jimgerdemannia flammicorona TaxID=994334 RepID=A0A433QF73_9FUNG|nr:hypothetical protein BC938DRAFT_481873 [Jimgerdemannia flammicorona]
MEDLGAGAQIRHEVGKVVWQTLAKDLLCKGYHVMQVCAHTLCITQSCNTLTQRHGDPYSSHFLNGRFLTPQHPAVGLEIIVENVEGGFPRWEKLKERLDAELLRVCVAVDTTKYIFTYAVSPFVQPLATETEVNMITNQTNFERGLKRSGVVDGEDVVMTITVVNGELSKEESKIKLEPRNLVPGVKEEVDATDEVRPSSAITASPGCDGGKRLEKRKLDEDGNREIPKHYKRMKTTSVTKLQSRVNRNIRCRNQITALIITENAYPTIKERRVIISRVLAYHNHTPMANVRVTLYSLSTQFRATNTPPNATLIYLPPAASAAPSDLQIHPSSTPLTPPLAPPRDFSRYPARSPVRHLRV